MRGSIEAWEAEAALAGYVHRVRRDWESASDGLWPTHCGLRVPPSCMIGYLTAPWDAERCPRCTWVLPFPSSDLQEP